MTIRNVLALSVFLLVQYALAAEQNVLKSPDENVVITVTTDSGHRVFYSVKYKEMDVLLDSGLGLDFKGNAPLVNGLEIRNVERISIDDKWQRVWGKRKNVVNQCNEMTLTLVESASPGRFLRLIFRAYNDGAAFRYDIPDQDELHEFSLTEELTEFRFPGNPTVWAMHTGFNSSQESEYNRMEINQLAPVTPYSCPLLASLGFSPRPWVVITEANLTNWAGMYFVHAGDRLNTLRTQLSPRVDKPDVLVKGSTQRLSPWRIIMIGDEPGDLIESDIVQNLNEPAAFDASWVKPGKSAWDWWHGPYVPGADFEVGLNTATYKYLIDFAAEMRWQYQILDEGWSGPAFAPGTRGGSWADHPTTDITTVIPSINLPELIRYAKGKNIKLILWLHWGHVDKQMDKAFPLYEKWGIGGVKIDFMNRDDQEMVEFYHRVVKKAAEHHLLVDFHGAYKPTGWSRTYPNLITREGVMGNEYNKWSARITPDHCLTIPFTRGLLGEMDFTPGGFLQKTKDTFRPRGQGPFVMGTRVFQLAMLVVYESALQVVCDSPYNYRISSGGLDFLKVVPTTWDDTRVIHGRVGDFITVARKAGDQWFVASMTDWDERTLEIPLSFLGTGKYNAEIWADDYEANEYPDRLRKEMKEVTSGDKIAARMASGGGHIIRLMPSNSLNGNALNRIRDIQKMSQ